MSECSLLCFALPMGFACWSCVSGWLFLWVTCPCHSHIRRHSMHKSCTYKHSRKRRTATQPELLSASLSAACMDHRLRGGPNSLRGLMQKCANRLSRWHQSHCSVGQCRRLPNLVRSNSPWWESSWLSLRVLAFLCTGIWSPADHRLWGRSKEYFQRSTKVWIGRRHWWIMTAPRVCNLPTPTKPRLSDRPGHSSKCAYLG